MLYKARPDPVSIIPRVVGTWLNLMIQNKLELNIVSTVNTTLALKHTLTAVKPPNHGHQTRMLAASHQTVKIDLHELQQEPNQAIPHFGDGIKADAPRVDIIEQTPQSDTGSNGEKSEETNMFDIENEANTSIDNETTE